MLYISSLPTRENALPFPRRLAVMGCTGSIGRNTLRVVEALPEKFQVEALAGGRNLELLAEQAARWRPPFLALHDAEGPTGINSLRALLPAGYKPIILTGPEGFAELAALPSVDIVLSAQSGAAGLRATVAAAAAGKVICLANKESLVLAGELLRNVCAATGAVILPVDSEHYALFQCMAGKDPTTLSRLILTASGGPFRGKSADFLETVRPEDALKHPNWSMGAKITIDSATLMNKGLEVIEACRLYDMPVDQVEVVVHPQSLVHSLVAFRDASLLGQFAVPDMRLPIAACLCWPHMPSETGISLLDLAKVGTLNFEAPNEKTFPCLDLARRALTTDTTVELNAANEIAVERFLARDIRFTDIPRLVEAVLDQTPSRPAPAHAGVGTEFSSDYAGAADRSAHPGDGHATGGETCSPAAMGQAVDAIERRDAQARMQAVAWTRH